jgi:hypothetical protein
MGIALQGSEERSRYGGVDLYIVARHRFRPSIYRANIGEHMPLRCMADAWLERNWLFFKNCLGAKSIAMSISNFERLENHQM